VPEDFDIKILYDGDCPLCKREMAWLMRRDVKHRVAFEDIASSGFDPTRYGRTQADVMARIHGQLPDGTVIEGVEVFRRVYRAVGLGWMLAWTRLPVARQLSDVAYRIFAANRLRVTGRTTAVKSPGKAS
jgi:predicted DCC family thiol-disulfide oxidoreductase YuxK